MEYIKQLAKSKTFWLGMTQVITGIGMYFTGEQNLQELIFGASGILTIIFRMITTTPIENK